MTVRKINCLLLGVFCALLQENASAQLCPPNLDFEYGDFSNWECRYGTVVDSAGKNVVRLPNSGQVPGRHTIISAATAGLDPYGGFPELCPNGSDFSVRLGNNSNSAEADAISYTFTIPASATVFSILYYYAVVLQDPNHAVQQQPRFRARLVDLSTNSPLPCVTFDFTASASLPGFRQSPINPQVLYKGWTPVTLNLRGYQGKTIMLEFITSDCTLGGHFGYAYMDVFTVCNGAIPGSTICIGDTTSTLTAPFGFQSYQWYTDTTFSTVLSTSQTLTLTPPPAIGTILPVVVSPFFGFGCQDTLYATITVSPKPVSVAGADAAVCNSKSVQLGAPANPGYIYSWTPAAQVSSPFSSSPQAWNTSPSPTEFILKTTDIITGCFSYDTTILSNISVDTAIRLTGKAEFCEGKPEATLSVNNTSAAIQWYNITDPVPGATSFTYQPVQTGLFWAQVTQQGCTDTTARIPVLIYRIPDATFTVNKDTMCVTNNSFSLTNTSVVADNAPMAYNWKFSDGSSMQTNDAVKTFGSTGIYTAELVASTAFGCKDSVKTRLYVLPNGLPDFTWDPACTNQPIQFRNLSSENGSAFVKYNWVFNDGGPGSALKHPRSATYRQKGTIDVSLQLTTLGCENDPKTITKKIYVNAAPPGISYRSITVPEGSSKYIHARDTVGIAYLWKPQLQLSKYNSAYTEFFATGNDVKYTIEITDKNKCVTTDTVFMQILKKPGYYLPTAFTPNGDGLNDMAKPYLIGMQSLKNFSVYNRWGNRIFYSEKPGEGWNGKYKGEDQVTGAYVWLLQFYNAAGQLVTETGTIAIIR